MKTRLHAHIGTLRQLEILLAVAHHGSVTAAAKALHLTQPTVSMQLKKLSEAIGSPLFYQVGRDLKLTEVGEVTTESAREVLLCFERLDMKLTKLRGLTSGTLRLAVVTTAKYFMPHLLGDFCQQFPNIEVDMNIGNRAQIVKRLAEGEDDFCVFSHPPTNDDYQLTEFLPNRLVAIAHQEHPLSQRKRISLKEFASQPYIMRENGSGTRYAIEQHMAKHNCELNVRMTIESNEAIKHMVMSGMGVSILSEHTLTFGGSAGLSILNVGKLPIKTNWYLVSLKSRPTSPIAAALLEFAQKNNRLQMLEDL
ncbi:LysR family transcriptional regulator [bacterium SCSIO 12696]|nr:LysR family transcriptional regulator [bacterium SCSIO 12696]